MRYKEIFTQIIKMFIMFSKLYFTEEERSYLEKLTRNILSFVESGAAGRDAFIYVFLYFLRSDFLRKNAEIFLQYIKIKNIIALIYALWYNEENNIFYGR